MSRTPAKKPAAKPKAKAKAAKAPRVPRRVKVFTVQRKMLGVYEETVWTEPDRVFATAVAAREYAGRLNREMRALTNPFTVNHFRLPFGPAGEKALRKLIAKFGLPAPAVMRMHGRDYVQWHTWWDAHYFDMTDAQRDAVWDALDRFDWYEVKPTTLEG